MRINYVLTTLETMRALASLIWIVFSFLLRMYLFLASFSVCYVCMVTAAIVHVNVKILYEYANLFFRLFFVSLRAIFSLPNRKTAAKSVLYKLICEMPRHTWKTLTHFNRWLNGHWKFKVITLLNSFVKTDFFSTKDQKISRRDEIMKTYNSILYI